MDLGIDVNAKDNSGNTPLMKVCQLYGKNNLVIGQQIRMLIEFGANIYLGNNAGELPLDLCPSELKKELLEEIHLRNQLKRRRTLEESLEYDFPVEDEKQERKRKRV